MRERLNFLLDSIIPIYESISVVYLLGVALLIIVLGSTSCSNQASSENASKQPTTPANASTVTLPTEVTETTKNPLPDLAMAVNVGKPLYQANCSLCHGETGAGEGPAGASFDPKPTHLAKGAVTTDPDGKLFLALKNGKGKMPPMKRMTDEEMWQVIAYVRTLAK